MYPPKLGPTQPPKPVQAPPKLAQAPPKFAQAPPKLAQAPQNPTHPQFPAKYRYAGVLPFAKVPSEIALSGIVFLIGREHVEANWTGSNSWSDFGGAPDGTERPDEAGAREFWEETMGILGNEEELLGKVRGTALPTMLPNSIGVMWLLPIKYDPDLPTRFENVYAYMMKCSTPHPTKKGFNYVASCPDGWLEKTAMMWISARRLRGAATGAWDKSWGEMPRFRPELLSSVRQAISQHPSLFPV